jgi:hypothetical protein
MFAIFSKLFNLKDDGAHDDYLNASSDFADLERRMRRVDEEEHAYSLHFCGSVTHDHGRF